MKKNYKNYYYKWRKANVLTLHHNYLFTYMKSEIIL